MGGRDVMCMNVYTHVFLRVFVHACMYDYILEHS